MNALQKKYGVDYAQANHPHKPHCHVQFVAFPCNQFGYQEPAENHELMNCIKYVRPGFGYEPNFPVTGKLEVNGAGESPLFTFLKARCPAPFGMIANRTDITWTPIRNNDISWNFQKWIVDHNGDPIKRYTSRTDPVQAEDDIISLINKCVSDGSNTTNGHGGAKAIDIPALKDGVSALPNPALPSGASPGSVAGNAAGSIPSGDEAQKEAETEAAKKEAAQKAAISTIATPGAGVGPAPAPAPASAPAAAPGSAPVAQAAAGPAAGPAAPPQGTPSKRKKRSLFDIFFN